MKNDDNLGSLMRKAQNGDNVAYNNLLKNITPILRKFIYNKLGDAPENEDILQEALLSIHKSSHTYNTDRPFKNWMFAICDYKIKDYLRKYYKKQELKEVDFDSIADFITKDVTNDAPANELLNEVLRILPDKQRDIVYMMKIDGYSVAQIASKKNMSVSAVKVSAHRAYKKLIAHGKGSQV